jgi:outer membrane protein insertion porin family
MLVVLLSSATTAQDAAQNDPSDSPQTPQGIDAAPLPFYGRSITAVEYLGLEAVAESKVERANLLEVGETYNRNDERRTLANLLQLRFFEPDLKIVPRDDPQQADGVILEFQFIERPIAERITITGNEDLEEELIRRELAFEEGDVYPLDAATSVESSIRDLYRFRGFNDVRVKVSSTPLVEGSVAVEIDINEGKRLQVRHISYSGNKSVSNFRLNLITSTKGSIFFIRNYFDETLFEADLETIRDYYLAKGFLDANVTAADFDYVKDGKAIDIVIEIEEGRRYTLESITFSGNTIFTDDELQEKFDGLVDRPLDRQKVREAIDEIRELYGNEGWILATIDTSYTPNADDATVQLELLVNEAQQITIGEIRRTERDLDIPEMQLGWFSRKMFQLAPPVKDEVVIRQISLKEGEVYRTRDEKKSLKRLRSLRVFRRVEIAHEQGSTPDVRNVNVYTETGNTGVLLLQGGFGGDEGGFGRVRVTERNLFGEARGLSLAGTLGTRANSVAISYLDRDFLESQKTLSAELFHRNYFRRGYDVTETGGSALVGVPLTDELRESYRVEIANKSIDPDDDVEADLDDYVLAAFRYGRRLDTRDDERLPTEGYTIAGHGEIGVADDPFLKFTADFEWYREVFPDWVYSVELSGGFIPVPTDRDDLGIEERFFLGGTGDLRGYANRGAGPKDTGEDDLALGGMTKLLMRNELRFPLGTKNLYGLTFLDVGTIDEDFPGLDTPRVGTGLGLRFLSNALDAGIDFGFALNRQSDDDTQIVHFFLESGL